ncbi:MAG: hypothetical protein QN141_07720 [Armatimonadota bacterium]|nr:hypothetical protein [Armatimonadota bacterium]MDR7450254.1 hypothetical protein [Armatimonadota bacterium]MDR7467163.1 hypothetical protein [Armatimonadota bacterium]MDR7493295.1 hypothetical protein [Armatimonadota bacterium]MDR7500144.1 hypothetical protein [Armatimonadota bacterium]
MVPDLGAPREVLRRRRHDLLARPNVVAAGLGFKTVAGRRQPVLSIVCSVTRKLPAAQLAPRDRIPATIAGVPTDVVATGPIRVHQRRTERVRPAPGGVSIGHRDVTAGTLGCLVKKDGASFILSNNHVLAAENDGLPGDPILQPGPFDGGRLPADQIAALTAFVPIRFREAAEAGAAAGAVAAAFNWLARLLRSPARLKPATTQIPENLVDAAIARPLRDGEVDPTVLEIGAIGGTAPAALGLVVRKSGRTTGLTVGEILQVDVTVDVRYGGDRVARFTDQLLASAMSRGGDSGSVVLDSDNRIVGLLFAGSETTTVITPIGHVFAALGVTL